jgi:hypothetical protein
LSVDDGNLGQEKEKKTLSVDNNLGRKKKKEPCPLGLGRKENKPKKKPCPSTTAV